MYYGISRVPSVILVRGSVFAYKLKANTDILKQIVNLTNITLESNSTYSDGDFMLQIDILENLNLYSFEFCASVFVLTVALVVVTFKKFKICDNLSYCCKILRYLLKNILKYIRKPDPPTRAKID